MAKRNEENDKDKEQKPKRGRRKSEKKMDDMRIQLIKGLSDLSEKMDAEDGEGLNPIEVFVIKAAMMAGMNPQSTVQERVKVDRPKKYNVILHNDDYTPMGFVVELLVSVFNMDRESATKLMLDIHQTGKGIAGTYIRSIAEMKISIVRRCAEEAQYPLHATMERE